MTKLPLIWVQTTMSSIFKTFSPMSVLAIQAHDRNRTHIQGLIPLSISSTKEASLGPFFIDLESGWAILLSILVRSFAARSSIGLYCPVCVQIHGRQFTMDLSPVRTTPPIEPQEDEWGMQFFCDLIYFSGWLLKAEPRT